MGINGINQIQSYQVKQGNSDKQIRTNYLMSNIEDKLELSTSKQPQKKKFSFKGLFGANSSVKFDSSTDIDKYNKLNAVLDAEGQKNLKVLYDNGTLLKNDSNDGSTTLDNLVNILDKPRERSLEANKILKYAVMTLAKPTVINQHLGNLPAQLGPNPEYSATCPTASIEFDLAEGNPAEFARYIERLSSSDKSVKVKMKFDSINTNTLEAINILNMFKAEYKSIDFNTFEITLRPDDKAYVRADIQEDNCVPNKRSPVDVLMQSTFMNLGSRGTYNSITDTRTPFYNDEPRGLVSDETTFIASIVNNKTGSLSNIVYQEVDENYKVAGYTQDFKVTEQQLMSLIDAKKNITAGITYFEDDKKVLGGHEITIFDYGKDENGEIYFKYQDSDDELASDPVKISAKELLPMIHHALIPDSALPNQQNNPYEIFEAYKVLKSQNQPSVQ